MASAFLYASNSFAEVNILKSKDLKGINGKEGVMLTVTMAPGESSPIHRHNAHTFVYVLEGSLIMQVEGGEPVTLTKGDTFYESPSDIHKISKNISKKLLAKFLVFFVKNKGLPILTPLN
jgi:quercetin dioxygenase-like cupin family protein